MTTYMLSSVYKKFVYKDNYYYVLLHNSEIEKKIKRERFNLRPISTHTTQ
jgi:hypothetical protein